MEPDEGDDYGITSLRGPVDRKDGKTTLTIPLDIGGDQLALVATHSGKISGNDLVITIPEPVADMIRLIDGDIVAVDDRDGKLNIHAINALPLQ